MPAGLNSQTLFELARQEDLVGLTAALCDIPSVSGNEEVLATAVAGVLERVPGLEILRNGNALVARTNLDASSRVLLAGHLDTVPVAQNLPVERRTVAGEPVLWGRGTVDMKAGVAVFLALAVNLRPNRDLTFIFYDNEEVEESLNGLGRIARIEPDLLSADFAILGEPTEGGIEGGCNGTLRAEITVPGVAAHSARAWTGKNAIHAAAPVLTRLAEHLPAEIEVDGLVYREGLNAVNIAGGIAGNVIPDSCVVSVNYRFAPSRTEVEAAALVREMFPEYQVTISDSASGARPGLDRAAAKEFAELVAVQTGAIPRPKYGWTDVARFAKLGIPAVNFGPGDPSLAHTDDENVPVYQILGCYDLLTAWLGEKTTSPAPRLQSQ